MASTNIHPYIRGSMQTPKPIPITYTTSTAMLDVAPFLLALLLVCLLIKTNESKFKLISSEEILTRQSLSQCIIAASKIAFTTHFETVTFSSPLEQVHVSVKSSVLLNHLLLPTMEEENRWTFLIRNLKLPVHNIQRHVTKSYSYIIHIRKEGEVNENVKRLKSFLSWNPHAKFLVMSPTVFPEPCRVAAEAIEALWKHNVVNVAILLANKKNTTKYDVYSWQPYSQHSCADNFTTTKKIDSCHFGVMKKNIPWFKEKVTKEGYNCSVKVNYKRCPPFVNDVDGVVQTTGYKQRAGIEVNLLNTISAALNVHLQYQESPYPGWGDVFENGTATDDLNLLKRNEIDLVAGGYRNTHTRSLHFDCSRAYMQESLVWCVPFEPIPVGFKNMVTILNVEVWICLFFVYFSVSFLIWYISWCSRNESGSYKIFINCLQNNFAILFGCVVNTPRTSMVRHILAMFMVFSLILNSAYTSYFTSIVSMPSYAQKYDDMEDIYKHNLQTYFVDDSIPYFQLYEGKKEIQEVPVSLILKRWRNCTDIRACLRNIAIKKNSAFCLPRMHKDYLLNNNEEIKNIKSLIYCLKSSVVRIPVNLIMRKGFPLFELFDDLLLRIISSGFITKWAKDNLEDEEEVWTTTSNDEDDRIKFENLIQIFCMLIVGDILSIMAFVMEFVIHRKCS